MIGLRYFEEAYLRYEAAKRRYIRASERRDEAVNSPVKSIRYAEIVEVEEYIVEKRRRELDEAKADLRRSTNAEDRVYYYAFVEKQKNEYIAKMIGYSKRQVCRIIGHLKKTIENERF